MSTKNTTVKRPMGNAERIRVRDGLLLGACQKMGCGPKELFVVICEHNPDKFYEWSFGDEGSANLAGASADDIREFALLAADDYFDGVRKTLLPDFISDVCLDIMMLSESLSASFKDTFRAIAGKLNNKKKSIRV